MNDEKVNEVFRAMENPQHNAWEPNRAGINANRYKRILQQLKRDIKQFVIEKGQGTISDEVDAEGIGEFYRIILSKNRNQIIICKKKAWIIKQRILH